MSEHHPEFGWDRDLSEEPQLCSLCGKAIPDEDVPLILFGPTRPDGDCYAWVYCDACMPQMLRRALDESARRSGHASVADIG